MKDCLKTGGLALVQIAYVRGEEKVHAYLKLSIVTFQTMVGVKNMMNETQVDFLANALYAELGKSLRVCDIDYVFYKASIGGYGNLYERISTDKVVQWFRDHASDRIDLQAIEADEEMKRRVSSDQGNQSIETIIARMIMKAKYDKQLENYNGTEEEFIQEKLKGKHGIIRVKKPLRPNGRPKKEKKLERTPDTPEQNAKRMEEYIKWEEEEKKRIEQATADHREIQEQYKNPTEVDDITDTDKEFIKADELRSKREAEWLDE